jgi:Arc/MetJ-type ribon-helix-helix transcriptional regulator
MRTVQLTLDERLVDRVDRAARRLGKSRSAFTRDALRDALSRLATLQKERLHRQGYEAMPARPGEFDHWSAGHGASSSGRRERNRSTASSRVSDRPVSE